MDYHFQRCAFQRIFHLRVHHGSRGFSSASPLSKSHVVIIGGGWAGFRVASDLDKSKFNVTLISPRNHFLFTPLLPSTAVGTLEFRCIEEPIRTIRNLTYYQASADSIDFESRQVRCTGAFKEANSFDVRFDKLIIAVGAETNTFNIEGVETSPHVYFLKQLSHARAIRNRLIECFERASSPGASEAEKRQLLTFIIVGGGPTSIEFAAEVYDFLRADVSKWYPDLFPLVQVKIVEAGSSILGSFASSLVTYVEQLFRNRNVQVLTNTQVVKIADSKVVLNTNDEVPFGLVVWSTGNKNVELTNNIQGVRKARNGRLIVDEYLHILQESEGKGVPVLQGDVYALGDCAVNREKPLPQLAQVASQQAIYIARELNKLKETQSKDLSRPFRYNHLVRN